MKKFNVMRKQGISSVEGYIFDGFGIHKEGKGWYVTDLATGMIAVKLPYATLKGAKSVGIEEAKKNLTKIKVAKIEVYNEYVNAFNKAVERINKESEGKKMTKTAKKSAKASTKVNTKAKKESEGKKMAKTTKSNEVEELKKEVEMLKASIEALTNALNTPKVESKPAEEKPKAKRARKPKVTIDTFDVEAYMSARDNNDRITEELVKALENTKGLNITRKGEDKWLYVKGETEADTKERKDTFKAMGFRWSGKENAWFIAPYPLANGKRWAAKKARKSA